MSTHATYVYGLLRAARAPDLRAAPAGLAGCGAPRALAAGAHRWLVVADAPLGAYSAESIEQGLRDLDWVGKRALEHEAVLEHLLEHGTVLPMKLFTLYLGDERAQAALGARVDELEAVLDALEGKREWGLRVLADPARALAASDEAAPAPASAGAGTAFLARKRRERAAARTLRARLEERARALSDELAPLCAQVRSRPPLRGEGRLVLDASFLVPREAEQAFVERVAERRAELARVGLELALSGPWPAYNFVEPAP